MAKSNSVKRSLYYYDFSWRVYDESEGKYKPVRNRNEKFANFLMGFQMEKGESIERKYILKTEKEDNVFLITDEVKEDKIYFRIVLCKLNALPLIENKGTLEELENYIDQKKNIAEVTHCIFFKDSGIVGAEFNFSGARVSVLNWYLPRILHINGDSNNIYLVRFDARINGDAYKKLRKNETLSLFELHFRPDSDAYKNVLAHKSLFRGAALSVPDAEIIEVTVKRRKKKENNFTGLNDILSPEELKELSTIYRDDIKKLYVSQRTYGDGVDLLSDKLVTRTNIIRTKKRTIDSKDAYEKIEMFYNEEVDPKHKQ